MAVEIPVVFQPWSTVQWPRRSDSDLEALMTAAPFLDPDGSCDELQPLREALVDCLDLLSERDRYVVEAIWFERATVRALADRLGICKSRCWEISQRAVVRLAAIAHEHPLLAERYDAA